VKALIVLVVAAVALVLPGAGRPDGAHLLVGTVGPGFTIDLADASGRHVDEVPAGHYTFVVHDLSAEHNFVFANKPDGQRVRIETEVEFVGDKTFEVDLAAGRYAYACSPHWQVMNGSLVADAPAVKPAPAPKPKPKAKPKPKQKPKPKAKKKR
jgi:hypothetical protein